MRMPSSPTSLAQTNPTRQERLLAALQTVPDPRDRRGVRYPLVGVLALAVTATVAGCRSFAAIGQWAAETAADKLASFGLTSGSAPGESTFRKLLGRLDADALDRALGGWMWTRTFTGAGGDYVFTAKANMPTLHHKLKTLPWKDMPAHTARTAERGRRVTGTIKVANVPDSIDFPGAAQVAQLRRTVTDKATKTVEVVYLITSASHTDAPPGSKTTGA